MEWKQQEAEALGDLRKLEEAISFAKAAAKAKPTQQSLACREHRIVNAVWKSGIQQSVQMLFLL